MSLAVVATAGVATALHKNDVHLSIDGESRTIAVRENTVEEVLELEQVELGQHDVVLPAVDTKVSEDMEITIMLGRPVEVTVDGQTREVWTTARTVEEALGFLNLDQDDSKISASRSAAIGREGISLEIATAKDVTLTVAGEPTALTIAGTVQDVLDEAGVTPDADDIVTPDTSTVLTDGLEISYIDVEVRDIFRQTSIPFSKQTATSSQMYRGESKVTTKGAEGVMRQTWTQTFHDGELITDSFVEEVVSQQPVHQVTTHGTKERPRPTPAPQPPAPSSSSSTTSSSSSSPSSSGNSSSSSSSSASSSSSESSSGGSSSGHAINLARAGMWDQIAECESNQRWNINTGNGYYGGLQFNLPTWRSVNGQDFAAYPHQASRAEQITVANRLHAQRGLQPWACARVVR